MQTFLVIRTFLVEESLTVILSEQEVKWTNEWTDRQTDKMVPIYSKPWFYWVYNN
jgi:hypothetical protein